MKNKIAKILSIVLVVVMIAGTLPIRQAVYAAEDPAIETETPNDSSEETDSTTARTSTPKPTDASTPAPATDDNQESSPSDTSDNQETTETTTDGTSKNTDGNEDNKKFTVTFDTNGGSEIESQQVNNGDTAKEPKDPTKDGFTFGGWYEDATFTAVFDFATPITADVKVYAKWTEVKADQPAFNDAKTVNGVTVTVSAPEGVFPKGSYLSVESVPVSAQSMVDEAVENERDANANVAVSYTFDIKVLDTEGNEVQPADAQSVKVSFALAEAKDDNLEAQVYHISDEGNAEALDTSVNGDAVEAVTDGFSFYTVEFTYGTMTYVLSGGSEVKLSDVLSYVGLSGEVTAASGSNDELFSVTKESGEWMIHSHQPFSTEEMLHVTINGTVYDIRVTDDQTITKVNITLDEPVIGETPDYSAELPYGAKYKIARNGIVWYDRTTNTEMDQSEDVFQRGHLYKVIIYLDAMPGYGFPASPYDVDVKLSYGAFGLYVGKNGEQLKIEYYCQELMEGCAITINEPEVGEKADFNPTLEGYNVHIESNSTGDDWVDWYDLTIDRALGKNGVFQAGHKYRLTVRLETNSGFHFTTLPPVTINGKKADVEYCDTGKTVVRARIYFDPLFATTYRVTFDPNGGSVTPTSAQTGEDGRLTSLPTPTREGYSFKNWCSQPTGGYSIGISRIYTEDTTIYAHWDKKSYTVSFDTHSGSAVAPQIVEYGGYATRPGSDPTKGGWDFTGWYEDAACTTPFDFSKPIKANTTIHAGWEPYLIQFTVDFNVDGGTPVPSQTVTEGDKVTKPEDPTKGGFTFAGWYKNSRKTVSFDFDNTEIYANTTIYAKWVANGTTQHYVHFMDGSRTLGQQRVYSGQTAERPTADYYYEKEGYLFVDWFEDSALTIPFDFENTPITSNTRIYSKWEEGHVVNYRTGGHTPGPNWKATVTVKDGTVLTVAAPAEDVILPIAGDVFDGWEIDSVRYAPGATYTVGSDIEVTYLWRTGVVSHTVTFDTHGGSDIAPVPVYNGETVEQPADPTKNGYAFFGWYTDVALTEKYDFSASVTGDITLHAKWLPNVIGLHLKTDGVVKNGSGYKMSVDVLTAIFHPSATPLALDTLEITDLYTDQNLTALLTTVPSIGTPYYFAVDMRAGTDVNPKVFWDDAIKIGCLTEETNGTIEFVELFRSPGNGSAMVVMKYTPSGTTTYTVTVNSGTADKTTAMAGETITLTADTAPLGKEFDKWIVDGGDVSLSDENANTTTFTMPAENVGVTATYKDLTYSVNFKDGDAILSTITVPHGGNVTKPSDPTKEGFTFDGWYQDATLSVAFSFDTPITADTTIYAKFVPVTITGISIATPGKTAYTVGDTLDVTGMEIKVDYSDGTSKTIPVTAAMVSGFDSSAPADSQTLTITYEGKTTTYDVSISAATPVTYDITVNAGANGTANASATAATEGTTITVTATPDSGYEIDKVTYTPEGGSATDITDSLSFTMPAAKVTVNVIFKAIVYTVTVQNDGNGTATASVTTGIVGTEVTLTATPNSGYQFKEWQVVSGGVTVTDNKFTIGTENVVVKAIFEEDTSATEYTVTFNANGHGTAPAAQTITSGGTATEPTAPTAEGWNFGGWYQDATCSVAFDFATPITADIVLYAKWTEVTPGTVYYTVVSGGNSSFTIGNASDIVVTVKRSEADETCFSHFTGVEIDGVALVNGTDYTAVAGSTVVTIKAATLNNLSAGGHTIKVIFDDGEATTSVTAKAASNNNNNNSNSSAVPSTGETLAPTLFVGIAFIAVAGMLFAVILVQRKKKTEQR